MRLQHSATPSGRASRRSTSPRTSSTRAFFRAFDFDKWEVWAADADAGWGAWSVETGWTAPWIHLSLGLRHANASLWVLGAGGVDAAPAFEEWLPFFFPEGACA